MKDMKDRLRLTTPSPLHEDIKAYAASYSLSREQEIGSAELRTFAGELMKSVSAACISRGAKVIGHIKAHIQHDSGFLHANTVGESSDVTVGGRDGDPVTRFTLVVNSVVYGLPEELVRKATEEGLEATSSKFSLKREVITHAVRADFTEKGEKDE
jgi:hypothetical protein